MAEGEPVHVTVPIDENGLELTVGRSSIRIVIDDTDDSPPPKPTGGPVGPIRIGMHADEFLVSEDAPDTERSRAIETLQQALTDGLAIILHLRRIRG